MTRLTAATIPPHIARLMRPEDRRALKVRTPEETQARIDERGECELQLQCEQWLALRGYARLTADNAAMANSRGWFGHWPEARRNPLTPDLLIWDRTMGRCLAVELKVRDVYQSGQREMIGRGAWVECRTLEAVALAVQAWEAGA